jgi:hypothetical protein
VADGREQLDVAEPEFRQLVQVLWTERPIVIQMGRDAETHGETGSSS